MKISYRRTANGGKSLIISKKSVINKLYPELFNDEGTFDQVGFNVFVNKALKSFEDKSWWMIISKRVVYFIIN